MVQSLASGPHRSAHHVAHWPAGLRGPRAGMARSRLFGGIRRRCWSGSRRAGVPARCGCTLIWCSCSRTGRRTGRRGNKLVPLSMRTALRHIGDGIEWAGLGEESPGTGQRRAGAHSLRHSAARHWLVAGGGPAQRGQLVAGARQRPGHAADIPSHRGQRLQHGRGSVARLWSLFSNRRR